MSNTPKHRAVFYITLLLIAAFLKPVLGNNVAQTSTRGRYNGKIVFISDRHYKGLSIWTMNPDGSSPTRLTDEKSRGEKLPNFSPVYDSSPVWSPDGTKIAFISNRNYLFSLYVMNADGSNSQLLTDLLEPGEPSWSPDSSKIAFSLGMRGSFGLGKCIVDIYVVNLDGSGLTQLTRDSGCNSSPAWTPDGKQIAFTSNRDGKVKLWVMNPDGSNQREFPNSNAQFHELRPTFSPDGTRILYTFYRKCRGDDYEIAIYVMNVDGSNTRLLTDDPNSCGVYSSPRWSPDGTKILASFQPRPKNNVSPPTHIIVMNADGSNRINISNRGQYVFNSSQSTFTDVGADWQPLHSPAQFAPSIVSFSAPSYTVNEDVGKAELTVKRTGNLNDVASCSYATVLFEAMPPEILYPDKSGTGVLRFAAGESTQKISIAIYNSKGLFPTDTYKVILSDNEGNATFLGGIKEATLKIVRPRTEKNPLD